LNNSRSYADSFHNSDELSLSDSVDIDDDKNHYHRHNHPDLCANKNLFLRNRKGDKHFLITILGTKMLDLKALGEKLGEKVGFASEERLLNILKLTRGSVSPFGLLNDTQRQTTFIIDADVLSYPKVGFHPNVNTQTVILKTDDFLKFLNTRGIKWAKDNF
jgi:Ala-tRNA(Pro) deacylase